MRILGREGMAEDNRFDTNSRRVENRDELHAEIERAADERELDIRGRRSVHGAAFCHGCPVRGSRGRLDGGGAREAHEDVWRRTTLAERARVLDGIAELLRRDREEVAQLESRDTGTHLSRTRVGATVATRYFEFYANTIESFYGDTIPVLEDKFGSWRQPESWT